MHSSRMRTAHFSGRFFFARMPPPLMHALHHTCPTAMHTHPATHAPLPCMPPPRVTFRVHVLVQVLGTYLLIQIKQSM